MNWGTKIVLGMVAFMLFIIAMVIYMFSVHGNDALVADDYYEKGINYNEEYEAKQNVLTDKAMPKITIGESTLSIELTESANYELKMMRPSDKNDDVANKGSTVGASNLILIDTRNMYHGLWLMELKWKSAGRSYLLKRNITL